MTGARPDDYNCPCTVFTSIWFQERGNGVMAESKWHVQLLVPLGLAVLVGIGVLVIRNEGDKNRQAVKEASDKLKQEIEDAPGNAIKSVTDEIFQEVAGDAGSDDEDGNHQSTTGRKDKKKDKQPDVGQLVSNVFKLGQDLAKVADDVGQEVLALSVEEERKIGEQLFQLIRKQHKVLQTGEQAVRLNRLAKPLVQKCKREGIVYTFSVLESDEINAFSHAGGYIYINTGLLEFVGSDEELEFVLGHEIGHVELKHCTRNLTYAARASGLGGELGGDLVRIAYHLVSVGYSEAQEFDADEWSYRRLRELGRSQEQALASPRHFMEKEKQEAGQKEKPKAKSSSAGAVVQEIDNHFRTHPDAAERLKRLERLDVKSGGCRGDGE